MNRHKFLFSFVLLGIAALLCSCNGSIREINTSSVSQLYDQTPPPMRLHDYGYSDSYPGVSSSYRHYNFVIGSDLEQFYKASVDLRMTILNDFYTQLNAQGFNLQTFEKEYHAFLSPHIKATSRGLDRWMLFKPQEANTKCQITYEGDDWFSVKALGGDAAVRLRVVLTGENLQPVIAEVENTRLGIKTGLAAGSDLGSGYTLTREWEYGIFNNKKRNNGFRNYVAGIIYHNCSKAKDGRSFITEQELLSFIESTEQKREQLLKDFYADLTAADFSDKSFSEKYDNIVTGAVANAMGSAKGKAAKSRTYGKWTPFVPQDRAIYTLAYDEQDWFTVSGDKAAKPDLYMQAVFYGQEMRPLIVGLYNEALNVNVQQEFMTDRNSHTFGWELRKHW